MAELMSEAIGKLLLQSGFLMGVFLGTPASFADTLGDPTRPPASVEFLQESRGSVATSVPILQSIIMSQGRRMAIINGQSVRLGEKFGAARLEKINESEVVLRVGGNLETLKLYPNIEKRLTVNRANIKPDSREPSR